MCRNEDRKGMRIIALGPCYELMILSLALVEGIIVARYGLDGWMDEWMGR